MNTASQAVEGIPEAKLQRFADEARALDTSRMQAMQETKRVALAVALIRVRTAQALDDLADMFIRRLQKLHQQANDALAEYRRQHQEQTDTLIALLAQIVTGWQDSDTPEQRLAVVDTLLGDGCRRDPGAVRRPSGLCRQQLLALPPTAVPNHRQLLLGYPRVSAPHSTSADKALEHAMAFVLRHRHGRVERLPVTGRNQSPEETLDVSWVPPRWWKAVTGRHRRECPSPVSIANTSNSVYCPRNERT